MIVGDPAALTPHRTRLTCYDGVMRAGGTDGKSELSGVLIFKVNANIATAWEALSFQIHRSRLLQSRGRDAMTSRMRKTSHPSFSG